MNEKCDDGTKLDVHFVDYEVTEDLSANHKLVEANCKWELGKGLGLYAEN